jgi:hypothetical protein
MIEQAYRQVIIFRLFFAIPSMICSVLSVGVVIVMKATKKKKTGIAPRSGAFVEPHGRFLQRAKFFRRSIEPAPVRLYS